MAQRRMFSKKVTNTDTFLDMPLSAQCLYFHLNMEADDDGFIGNAKTIRRMIGASEDDLKLLLAKEFAIPFDSGVVVIKDWKVHNYIRKDRYNETIYKTEKSTLSTNENEQYEIGMTDGLPMVDQRLPQVRLGKDRLGKDKKDITPPPTQPTKESKTKHGEFKNVLLTDGELEKLKEKFPKDLQERIERLSLYIESQGKKYKSHYATILSWARRDEQQQSKQPTKEYDYF